jgi:hypothetical protein
MFSVYRPHFYLPEESEPRLRYAVSWFTFIRWHLAPIFNNRFRADWQSEFAPMVDQIKGQKDGPPPDFTAAVSDDAKEFAVWRLDLCADVQATACAILAEELEQLLEAVEQRLGQLSGDPSADVSVATGPVTTPPDAAGGGSRTAMTSDVFLSYNSDDRPVVEQLAAKLEGLSVWMDKGKQGKLSGGENWQNGIRKGIDGSWSVAVCIGAGEVGPWQKEETQYALNRATTDKKFKVIPVLLPGAPDEPKLPFALGNRHWVDFRNGFHDEELRRLIHDIKAVTYPTPDNLERDGWIYEQRRARRTIPDIQSELGNNKHGWEPLFSDNGIRDAVERYAKHFALPRPKSRPGKPRRQ